MFLILIPILMITGALTAALPDAEAQSNPPMNPASPPPMVSTAPPRPLVPAIDPVGTGAGLEPGNASAPKKVRLAPPPMSSKGLSAPTPLNPKEKVGVALAEKWKNAPELPVPDEDGSVTFVYGATLPSIVCSPLFVCDIELEAGEVISGGIQGGDKVRWKISPAVSGTGPTAVHHIIVKPTAADLKTNILVMTSRRTYRIKLVSTKDDWMPSIKFSYPEDEGREWASYRNLVAQQQQTRATNTLPNGDNISAVDFAYTLSGDNPSWKPVRVYNNGAKTYIQFKKGISAGEMPILVALGTDDENQMINYRPDGDGFVIDKVLEKGLLTLGVGGSAEKVTITHEGAPR